MSKVLEIRGTDAELVGYAVRCPACDADDRGHMHVFYLKLGSGPGWEFSGDLENPTFRPSMLSKYRCGETGAVHTCHSFVTDGKIQYLSDCTHRFAGHTLALPDF